MCMHNLLHQRDSFRMFYFDLYLLSSHSWGTSHALSHHLFTNTRYDLEITNLKLFLVLMSKPCKTFVQRYGAQIRQVLLLPLTHYMAALKKLKNLVMRKVVPRPEYLLPVVELLVMWFLSPTVGAGFKWVELIKEHFLYHISFTIQEILRSLIFFFFLIWCFRDSSVFTFCCTVFPDNFTFEILRSFIFVAFFLVISHFRNLGLFLLLLYCIFLHDLSRMDFVNYGN